MTYVVISMMVLVPFFFGGLTSTTVMAVKNGGFIKPQTEKVEDKVGVTTVTKSVFVPGWMLDFLVGGIAAVLAVNTLSVFTAGSTTVTVTTQLLAKVIAPSIGAGVAPISYLNKFALANQQDKELDNEIDQMKNRRRKIKDN